MICFYLPISINKRFFYYSFNFNVFKVLLVIKAIIYIQVLLLFYIFFLKSVFQCINYYKCHTFLSIIKLKN